jgi:hypothetical protein
MKKLLSVALLLGLTGVFTGCATPGYTGGWPKATPIARPQTGENADRFVRAAAFDMEQIADDFNRAFLLDSPSHLSRWNLR